jgi:probable phosphoglycerate mutase
MGEWMKMTQIGLIRHGITSWNIENRAQGHADIPLNELGRRQAISLAKRLKDEEWDIIYSSDLSRAKVTAEVVAESLGLNVITDERLREMNCGEIEGTTIEERIARWGSNWELMPLGIETEESIVKRGMSFITYINEKHKDKRVLVVSHGALVGLTLKRLIPHVDTEEHLHNTSLTILKCLHNNKWDCELYNCAKHIIVD